MKNVLPCLLFFVLLVSCSKTVQKDLSEEVLNETYTSLNGQTSNLGDILSKYDGKLIVIDIWASWCKDCIVGLPELKALQKQYPEAVYLFLSADRSIGSWKRAINKYNIEGEHYFMPKGTKGLLGKYIDVDWIPRYMIVDSNGKIIMFEAIKADDPKMISVLKQV